MAYLNLDPTYFTHRKTLRLVARLGPGAELLPLKLWAYCAQHHPKDGALRGYEQAELEAMLGHGQALLGGAQVVPALVAVGFLEELPDATGWVCHDWLDHQGHLAAFKERAERAAKARWDKARMLKHASSIATVASEQCNEQCPVPTIPTIPNQVTTLSDSVESDGAGEEIKPESNPNQNNSSPLPLTTTTTVSAKPKRATKDLVDPGAADIPADLRPYESSIREFAAWRRESLRKPILAGSWGRFLGECRKFGATLPAVVAQSIANGWQGLFALKSDPGATSRVFAGSQTDQEVAKYGGR